MSTGRSEIFIVQQQQCCTVISKFKYNWLYSYHTIRTHTITNYYQLTLLYMYQTLLWFQQWLVIQLKISVKSIFMRHSFNALLRMIVTYNTYELVRRVLLELNKRKVKGLPHTMNTCLLKLVSSSILAHCT